ncbi:MAG TPA: NPCBM/NEW2 domain-containing protein [Baekduia sp.]|nr:NPCBM/NEW2 domain-containing protein [Baekduia sp.]
MDARPSKLRSYYLSALPLLNPASGATTGAAQINGRNFARSVLMSPGVYGDGIGHAEFNLKRRCKTLTFTAGITDDSSQDSAGEFSVAGGGGDLDTFSADFGQAVARTVSVRGVLRLTLEATPSSNNGGFQIGWGDAKVRCTRLS